MSVLSLRCAATLLIFVVSAVAAAPSIADDPESRIDYLSFAQGALPVTFGGDAEALRVGMEHALRAIDGDSGVFGLVSKPGGAHTSISFVYKLPALTTFSEFAVPNVLETPSPSQTFVRDIEFAGSESSADGEFAMLANASLETHSAKGQVTSIPVLIEKPVRWVRVSLTGGIEVERDKTFFEFSEAVGYGRQEPVPMLEAFDGKWKGRGVLLELTQDGANVSGCYDSVGDLTGNVSGNLLRATGKTRDGGIPSTFVLTVGDDGEVIGVRSTNGAPFKIYTGDPAPGLVTECSGAQVQSLGCGSVLHGIQFDFDSSTIRPDSKVLLDSLASGLKATDASSIVVIGHTSSEGSDAYNDKLSQRRAEAVVAALVGSGIDAARLSAQGRGEKQPIAENATEAGRTLNRRVEIACP